jgi:hypothetical protein
VSDVVTAGNFLTRSDELDVAGGLRIDVPGEALVAGYETWEKPCPDWPNRPPEVKTVVPGASGARARIIKATGQGRNHHKPIAVKHLCIKQRACPMAFLIN